MLRAKRECRPGQGSRQTEVLGHPALYNYGMTGFPTPHPRKLALVNSCCPRTKKRCPDSISNHRCRSALRTNCKRRDSRCENRSATTSCSVRYCRTQQYSITALTDSLGAIQERYAYDAYGNLSIFDGAGVSRSATAEGNRYTYTGREWDEELELYHYRARMYDPVCGRFLGRDPIGYSDGFHLCQYTSTSPCNYIDPLGLETGSPSPVECCRSCEDLKDNAKTLIPELAGPNDKPCRVVAICGSLPPDIGGRTRKVTDNFVLITMNEDVCWSFDSFNLAWEHEMVHVRQFCSGKKCENLSPCDECMGDVPFVVETRDGLTCSNRTFFNLSGKRARRE